jgi:hypothetical protein
MTDLGAYKEAQQRLARLVNQQQSARRKTKDHWGLTPIERGWVRGRAMNVRQSEQTCEYGVLNILEFEMFTDPKQPGIAVRMQGTTIDGRVMDGQVVDIPDPTPNVRPMQPDKVYFSHHVDRKYYVSANYPGRTVMTPRRNLMLATAAIGGPIAAILGIVALLHFVFRIFG